MSSLLKTALVRHILFEQTDINVVRLLDLLFEKVQARTVLMGSFRSKTLFQKVRIDNSEFKAVPVNMRLSVIVIVHHKLFDFRVHPPPPHILQYFFRYFFYPVKKICRSLV